MPLALTRGLRQAVCRGHQPAGTYRTGNATRKTGLVIGRWPATARSTMPDSCFTGMAVGIADRRSGISRQPSSALGSFSCRLSSPH